MSDRQTNRLNALFLSLLVIMLSGSTVLQGQVKRGSAPASEQPVPGVDVTLKAAGAAVPGASVLANARTDAKGQVTFDVAPGSYILSVRQAAGPEWEAFSKSGSTAKSFYESRSNTAREPGGATCLTFQGWPFKYCVVAAEVTLSQPKIQSMAAMNMQRKSQGEKDVVVEAQLSLKAHELTHTAQQRTIQIQVRRSSFAIDEKGVK